jgi:hypothetical protein
MKASGASAGIAGPVAIAMAASLAAIAPSASQACGACIEDRIAATYDHRVIDRAAARGDVMVFCAITGPLDAQRLKQAVGRVRGVLPQSVRVSAQPAALSFAVDPRVRSPQAAVDAAQRSLASGTHVSIVRLRGPAD